MPEEQYTYRDPTLSLWQAAVAEVHRRRTSVQSRLSAGNQTIAKASAPGAANDSAHFAAPALASEDALMSPVHAVSEALQTTGTLDTAVGAVTGGTLRKEALGAAIVDCAKTAAKFLWAEIKGDTQQAAVLAGELKFSACDVAGWSECVATYLEYKVLLEHPVYRANQDRVFPLPQTATIAILSDWGTGDPVAINVLQQVAKYKPDMVLHLGDIYYAGTQSEVHANFLDVCRTVLGSNVPLFTLCGNHDMYSSGSGYYGLLDTIGQGASYFCLQNDDWLILAMDTGYNDRNPVTVASNMTSLVTQGNWSEAAWHLARIAAAGNRKIVLLSHHQLFSPFGSVGSVNDEPYAYNPNLYGVFQPVLSKVAAWFWGHEHTLALFPPYMGLAKGRCVGGSAVPVFTDQQHYAPSGTALKTFDHGALPTWDTRAELGNNGTDYDNCFAMMHLAGGTATVEYYTVPILGTAVKLNVEDIL